MAFVIREKEKERERKRERDREREVKQRKKKQKRKNRRDGIVRDNKIQPLLPVQMNRWRKLHSRNANHKNNNYSPEPYNCTE